MNAHRYWALIFSSVITAVMILLSFTPIVWNMGGRHSENYPEFFFIFYGLPTAIILLFASLMLFLLGDVGRGGPYRSDLKWLWVGACITLAVGIVSIFIVFFSRNSPDNNFGQLVITYYPVIILPVDLLIVLFGTWMAFRDRHGA